mmetsp:Transcript_111614/g.279506  ORF Transcript_111614/g.279506 Transcript_111614/m.279506 type:complete len:230 (+) Transcript_111614:1728-2417(+)
MLHQRAEVLVRQHALLHDAVLLRGLPRLLAALPGHRVVALADRSALLEVQPLPQLQRLEVCPRQHLDLQCIDGFHAGIPGRVVQKGSLAEVVSIGQDSDLISFRWAVVSVPLDCYDDLRPALLDDEELVARRALLDDGVAGGVGPRPEGSGEPGVLCRVERGEEWHLGEQSEALGELGGLARAELLPHGLLYSLLFRPEVLNQLQRARVYVGTRLEQLQDRRHLLAQDR